MVAELQASPVRTLPRWSPHSHTWSCPKTIHAQDKRGRVWALGHLYFTLARHCRPPTASKQHDGRAGLQGQVVQITPCCCLGLYAEDRHHQLRAGALGVPAGQESARGAFHVSLGTVCEGLCLFQRCWQHQSCDLRKHFVVLSSADLESSHRAAKPYLPTHPIALTIAHLYHPSPPPTPFTHHLPYSILLCATMFIVHLIRISAGIVRGSAGSSSSSSSPPAVARSFVSEDGGGGVGEGGAPQQLQSPEQDLGKVPELAGINWASKNIDDVWEQPVARHLHLNPSDLEDAELAMPVLIPVAAELQGDHDLDLTLCQFDITPYHRNPEQFPMSKDLIMHFCSEQRRSNKLASILAEDPTAGKQLQPTGFVFHESRVGSTLVANMLASVPTNLVYSEPSVPAGVIHACDKAGCSEETTVRLLRMAILAMGRSHIHDHFFIKFSSSLVVHMDLVIKAFPETPWVFIYRDPVEVMVSNFMRGKGNGPCVRAKSKAPEAVQEILGTDRKGASKVSDEEYCAAHLTMLCQAALREVEAEGSKGQAVPYESLVEDMLKVVVPGHFGVSMNKEETARMMEQSELYSKARAGETTFEGDVEEKHEQATPAMEKAAEKYLSEPTEALRQASQRGRRRLEEDAALRMQEARVYERTGSRFFQLPHCPGEPEYPPEVSASGFLFSSLTFLFRWYLLSFTYKHTHIRRMLIYLITDSFIHQLIYFLSNLLLLLSTPSKHNHTGTHHGPSHKLEPRRYLRPCPALLHLMPLRLPKGPRQSPAVPRRRDSVRCVQHP